MLLRKYSIFFLLLFTALNTWGQKPQLKRLVEYYETQNYSKAVEEGEKCIQKYADKEAKKIVQDFYLYTAASLMKLNAPQKSLEYFQQVEELTGEFEFMYIEALMQNKNFREAQQVINTFQHKNERARVLFAQCAYALKHQSDLQNEVLEEADGIVNSKNYYGIHAIGSKLLVSKHQNKSLIKKNPLKDLKSNFTYVIEDHHDEKFSEYFKDIHLLNISYPAYDSLRQVLFFSANYDGGVYASKYISRNKNIREDQTNTLALYVLELKTGKLEMLPFVTNQGNFTHPTITDRGNTLFFASDKPGGRGGFDIYMVKRKKYSWEKPRLLRVVNTSQNDAYPYCQNGKLYFASKGHKDCLGGYDIYEFDIERERMKTIPVPVNSSYDDLHMIQYDVDHTYIVSNRGGADQDKVYTWSMNEISESDGLPASANTNRKELNIILIDYVSEEYVPLVNVSFESFSTFDLSMETSNDLGMIQTSLPMGMYTVYVEKEGFESDTLMLKVDENVKDHYVYSLRPDIKEQDVLTIRSIFFEFNQFRITPESFRILDNFAYMLMDHPDIMIEIGSHTDSQGDDVYNLRLSEQRAKAAMNYLIEKGVEAGRLRYRGYGETRLLNSCDDGVDCDDQEHELNRRVEFRILR